MPPAEPDIRRQIRSRLLALPPRAFELFAGDLLGFIGLRDVTVTRYIGDGGIDATGFLETSAALISIPTGVQVKRHRANVQRSDIDRFIGALSGQYAQGIFITTAGYAPLASQKAASFLPPIATLGGEQIAALMLRHSLGITARPGAAPQLDDAYFAAFVDQATSARRVAEEAVRYIVDAAGRMARSEEDLISLRALSHALRVDTSTIRRQIERGALRPDQPGPLFRRDQIPAIRTALRLAAAPVDSARWRQELLDFVRRRNLTKSYKPVLLLALLKHVDRDGAASFESLLAEFRAFYVARRAAGLPVEFGPPDLSDPTLPDAQLAQLVMRHPLERFLIKGLLEYAPGEGVVRFAPALWAELRAWELLELQRESEAQLAHYYGRAR